MSMHFTKAARICSCSSILIGLACAIPTQLGIQPRRPVNGRDMPEALFSGESSGADHFSDLLWSAGVGWFMIGCCHPKQVPEL